MRAGLIAAAIAHCMLASAGGAADPPHGRYEFESKHMGTSFRLTLYAADAEKARAAAKDVFARVAELDKTLTDYDPKSDAMRACAANDAAPGKPVPVGPDLFAVLAEAEKVSKVSAGAFDATVGPLSKLWRLTRRTQQMPAAGELAAARAKVGFDELTLDSEARSVTFSIPGMRLDFGGIAKGYAADEALRLLRTKHHIPHALVAASGDITCGDAPPGQPGWAVDIQPLAAGRPARRLTLANAAVSTSGDLDQVAVVDGVRYSHVLNPKTGLGLTGRRSVTVVARTGTWADSLTKAASVLPAAGAVKLIDSIDGAAVYMVVRDPESAPEVETASARIAGYLAK